MRQLKYFVKGEKGNIEVTKGTYLSLRRKDSKKIEKKKIVFETKGTEKKKLVIKQIKSDIQTSKINSLTDSSKTNRYDNKQQFPNTAESLKSRNGKQQDPMTTQFCTFNQNEVFAFQNRAICDSYCPQIETKLTDQESIRAAKGMEANLHDCKLQHMIVNEDVYNEDELGICEQSSWSMINEHVEQMKLTLCLGYFDYMYGRVEGRI